ncbi:nuclear cap-binding subunit 1 [Micractinium conductrix]|uniref:Nuclear cap-binding subunit 1 n=1 Tax=Micractinium conductrix TaxID=554055 RepID=A0A2P6VPF5_9CHLO|nr:nuclear cap-binding subunit 1 [Micractinium conductrix]|eukprot:PSC75984.1 nuclear cap-binding subunit 1 [Micractinium conductrix]
MGDYRRQSDGHGGYGGGGGGGYAGHKRRREEEAPVDSSKQLLAALISLGDPGKDGVIVAEGEALSSVVKGLRREGRANPGPVYSMLLDCAVQLGSKAPVYALLVGLVNADEPELAAGLVAALGADLAAAFAPGGDARRARLLLRFASALVPVNVLHAASLLGALRGLVGTAQAMADASAEGDDGRAWQPYADHLAYAALLALPWGGHELAESVPGELAALMEAVEGYMAARPRASQPSLRPFAAAIKEDDPVAESDNGGASFLGEVVAAVKEMVDSGSWQLESVPRLHAAHEVVLAAGQGSDLPRVEAPAAPPVALPEGAGPELVGALVLEAYPPRGIIRLLEKQHTLGDRPLIERLVAEEYMLDTVFYFEPDRVECAKRLAGSLPLPYAYEPLLCEVLFGQMLRLPRPQFKPLMYSTLMVDLCKLRRLFPRAMSACVRESFARMNVMDPHLRLRLAEWLAYHLSNFEYVWPWAKWAHVLHAPAFDGQRRFCVAVLNRLVRLSYWERIQSVLPEEFRPLLPPKPEVAPLPAPEDEASAVADPEGHWAARMLQRVRSKATPEEIDAWQSEEGLEERLGGRLGVLRCWGRCLLVAGAKSYTHMVIALERYYGPLKNAVDEAGLEGEAVLMGVANSVWRASPQRAAMAVDRLMTLRLVSVEAIVGWVFGSQGVRSLGDESLSGAAWEILYNAINKTIARVQDAREDLAATENAVRSLQAQVEALLAVGEPAADAASQLEQASAALADKLAYVEETRTQQQGAFLQVLRRFVEVLSAGHGSMEGDAMHTDADEATALQDFMLAALRSFVRRYNVQCAQIAERIRGEVLGANGVPAALRAAVEAQLSL